MLHAANVSSQKGKKSHLRCNKKTLQITSLCLAKRGSTPQLKWISHTPGDFCIVKMGQFLVIPPKPRAVHEKRLSG